MGEGAMIFWAMQKYPTVNASNRYECPPQGTMDEEYFCVDGVERYRRAQTDIAFGYAAESRWTENCTREDCTVARDRARTQSCVAIECAGDTVNY